MTSSTSILPIDPIQCDECQAHAHKEEAQSSEAGSLNFWSRVHWFSGNDTDVKKTWENEDQARSRGCTNDAKNITNVGHTNDEQVDYGKETQCNRDVTHPMEGFIRE